VDDGENVHASKSSWVCDGDGSSAPEAGTPASSSSPRRIVALLGASPGASTAVWIMVHMLENCFHEQLVGHWVPKLKEMIPSYGHDLKTDAALTERVRAETAEVLKLQTV
jgi:malate dehydrogenase (quinone)